MQKKGINNPLFKDKTGERHGRLTITGKAPGSRKSWYVKCDCGNTKIILYHNLRTTTSCGCYKKENTYRTDNSGVPFGASTRYLVLDEYKRGAFKRNLTWELKEEEFDKLTSNPCHYCGCSPQTVRKSQYNKGDFVYNGIDRVDNTKGYLPDNVVSCCTICNRAKDIMTQGEFLLWIERVHNKCA